MKKEKILTIDEAYDAMYDFLDKYYDKTHADDLGSLLGSMSLWADETSADAAMLEDWNESVEKVLSRKHRILPFFKLSNEPDTNASTKKLHFMKTEKILSIDEAYDAMFAFLERYYNEALIDENIKIILCNMSLLDEGKSTDPTILADWNESVEKILTQKDRVRPYL